MEREPPASWGLQGEVLPLRSCARGAASATLGLAQSTESRASDQGGLVPPEERVATLATSEGPTCYRQVGVATRDEAAGFKSPRSPQEMKMGGRIFPPIFIS